MFLFKKVRINSTKANEKKGKIFCFPVWPGIKKYSHRGGSKKKFSCYFVIVVVCLTIFLHLFSQDIFLRPPKKKTGNEGPFFLFSLWIPYTTFIWTKLFLWKLVYDIYVFFNQWHGESALRSIWLWWDVLSVHKNVFEISKRGTLKLAKPTELSTELSVNQVDSFRTIFSFIQLLVFSL